ncbi:MAG TPA: fumarate hydratase [Candidatus Goldiibacteriota bacterium]|nr:fumarate hydratase [Candidatus Goldiibacteriota bacterium]HPN63931.1 fumarate hydratase [Candidatus Goldiibacteriota bacterium]HRQ43612.1 fumarate hydratase [Candidatus Goldiibacteriota bacterium]
MRLIRSEKISEAVEQLVIDANYFLPYDIVSAVKEAAGEEKERKAKNVLYKIVENYKTAKKGEYPLCQDTGIVVAFLEVGNDVKIEGDVYKAVNRGVENGYKKGFLRKSVADPLTRKNTGTNTPCVVHTEIKPGNTLKITIMTKGAGAENKSAVKMLTPADGEEGIINFVTETVKKAGASACPPYIIGIGIGGNLERAPYLAKKALLREIGSANTNKEAAALEKKIFKLLNKLNIGPLGFGGMTTALSVMVETFPCHIASLPVAVNVQCHSSRHKSITI